MAKEAQFRGTPWSTERALIGRYVGRGAGVETSSEKLWRLNEPEACKGRVFVLDIERMMDFAITEGSNEISELHRLFGLEAAEEA